MKELFLLRVTSLSELISLALFILFWAAIFAYEVKYWILFLKRKTLLPSKIALFVHIFFILGIFCFFYAYFIEPYWLKVNHVEIVTDKLENTDLTIVQISDLHCDVKVRSEPKLVRIINQINPDIIVFTGDGANTKEAVALFKKTMASLKAKLGKFAVRGNYDWYWRNINFLKDTGFTELNSRTVILSKDGEPFAISGINFDSNLSEQRFLYEIPPSYYSILLYHFPGINEEFWGVNVDLFLTGHTHGGQLALPFYGAIVTLSKYGKKYEKGRYDIDGRILYVNRGIGMEGGIAPRIRFLARPEITVFHIRPLREEN
ncbi:MAG: metallophosphoesterase [Candidatus Omnitrophota bacterium]|nr:metallophosphoesterase [Candidatus Omnitrophota bacterium]